MRVLVIGSGGREHALCWAIAASPLLTKLWCAPGNPGIAAVAECVPIGVDGLRRAGRLRRRTTRSTWSSRAPRRRLVAGITDAMEAAGDRLLRPDHGGGAAGGQQDLHQGTLRRRRHSRPRTGNASRTPTAAREFVRRRGAPIVVKADGLAAGKGVVVAATEDAALAAIDRS